MPPDKHSPRKFERRLLHHRGAEMASLLSMLPDEEIEAVPYSRDKLLFDSEEVCVLLLDRDLHSEIAEPPPDGMGEAADRLGVVVVGDRSGAADGFWPPRVYFSLPEDAPEHHLARAIRSVFRFLEERTISAESRRSLAERTHEIENLNQIGIALAAETDPQRLISTVLSRARDLTQADAGSLYVVEKSESGESLRFQAAQNDSRAIDFQEVSVPLDKKSLAGYVASTGEVLRLDDVYRLTPDLPYHFNPDTDESIRYKTKSMLVVPMKNTEGRVIGVLQLMNRKRRVVPDMSTTAMIRVETVAFDEQNQEIARSLASQAAVALENARLTDHLKKLFEGFVAASVTAIEQRDPTTSGHSERVAILTCALAQAADRAPDGAYRKFKISPPELTALRYAAVLHDFGKVGVRESVLVKARKLPPGRLELLRERFEKARVAAAAHFWQVAARKEIPAEKAAEQIARELAELEKAWQLIVEADEPSVLPVESSEIFEKMKIDYLGVDGKRHPLLHPDEKKYLSISKGSLNEAERKEIESHVTQTFRFLSRIPWTPELSRVPELAYLHHEKLDGSGYPRGIRAEELAPPVRMMTICDIFDALSASDRPYKRAVARAGAIDILHAEAKAGKLDPALLDIFIGAKIFEATAPNQ
jgi:HD-GYP domain-containing protein (c-di-GMP phosphodiesterase class II)